MLEYREEVDYDLDDQNESRADLAEWALKVSTDCNGERVGDVNEVELDISDLLANVRHLCDRAGLSYGALDDKAQRAYEGDHEDGPPTKRDESRYPEPPTPKPKLDGSNPDWMDAFTVAREAGASRDDSRPYADAIVLGQVAPSVDPIEWIRINVEDDDEDQPRYQVHGIRGDRFHIVDVEGEHVPADFGTFDSVIDAQAKADELND